MSKSTKTIGGHLADNVIPLNPGRAPSKTDQLIELLRRDGGASIEEISEAFGWLPHSSRAKLTDLRKAGHAVERRKQGSVTTYRLVQPSSNSVKGSSDKLSNIGACNTASLPPNINPETRPALR